MTFPGQETLFSIHFSEGTSVMFLLFVRTTKLLECPKNNNNSAFEKLSFNFMT